MPEDYGEIITFDSIYGEMKKILNTSGVEAVVNYCMTKTNYPSPICRMYIYSALNKY